MIFISENSIEHTHIWRIIFIFVLHSILNKHGSVVYSCLANLGNPKSAENKLVTPSYSLAKYGVVLDLFMHMVFLGPAKADKLRATLPHL